MDFGASMFMTDYCDPGGRSGPGARGARFRIAVEPGALAHPAVAQDAVPGRRRIAENVLRRDGPVRDVDRRGGRDQEAEARHRRLPGDPARHDPDREAGRLDRPGVERPLPVRHRRRLEPGRDGGPRHGLCDALQADARADRGDEDDLDREQAGISRRASSISRR